MNVEPGYVIYLGTKGWRHPGWRGGFYPTDLPEDWMRAFYATQFSCVWLDAEEQRRTDFYEGLRAWLTETPPSFLLLLEPMSDGNADTMPSPDEGRVIACSGHYADRVIWFDRSTDMRALTERIQSALGHSPLYLLSRDNDLGMVERVKTLLQLLGL